MVELHRRRLNHLHQAQVLPIRAISLHNRMEETLLLMVKASKKRLIAGTEISKTRERAEAGRRAGEIRIPGR